MGNRLPYRANHADMIKRLRAKVGAPRDEAKLLWSAVLSIIREELIAGREVWLWGLGRFEFSYYGPRRRGERVFKSRGKVITVPAGETKASWNIRLKINTGLKRQLKTPMKYSMPKPTNYKK